MAMKRKLSTDKTHRSIKGIYFDQSHLILVNLLYKSLFEKNNKSGCVRQTNINQFRITSQLTFSGTIEILIIEMLRLNNCVL